MRTQRHSLIIIVTWLLLGPAEASFIAPQAFHPDFARHEASCNLAPVLSISDELVKRGLSKKEVGGPGRGGYRGDFYVMRDASELSSPRKRTPLDIQVLSRVSESNKRARRHLALLEKDEFVFVSLDFADAILNIIPREYKEDTTVEALYFHIVAIKKAVREIQAHEQGQIKTVLLPFAKKGNEYTQVVFLKLKEKNEKAPSERLLARNEGFTCKISTKAEIKAEENGTGRKLTVELAAIQKNEQGLSEEDLTSMVVGPRFKKLDVHEIETVQARLMRIAENEALKRKEFTPIDDDIAEKMRGGFQLRGRTFSNKMAVGRIVVAQKESAFELSYPLSPYKPEDIEDAIKKFRKAAELILTANATGVGFGLSYVLAAALRETSEQAQKRQIAPIALFYSYLIDAAGKTESPDDVAKIGEIAQSVSEKLYPRPRFLIEQDELSPRTSKERILVSAFEKEMAPVQKRYMSVKDNEIAAKDIESDLMRYKDILRRSLTSWRRDRPASLQEAVFRGAQPLVSRLISDQRSSLEKDAVEAGGIASNIIRRITLAEAGQKEKGLPVELLSPIPVGEKFFLFLLKDITTVDEYEQLRKAFPDMVGIITLSGPKHYHGTAEENGFPVLFDAGASVETEVLDPRKALKGGELAIFYPEESTVLVNPSLELRNEAGDRIEKQEKKEKKAASQKGHFSEQVFTKDNVGLTLMVNIGSYKQIGRFPPGVVKGIGLYRTEHEFDRHQGLSNSEWEKKWEEIFEVLADSPGYEIIRVRLPDRRIKKDSGIQGDDRDGKDAVAFRGEGKGRNSFEGVEFLTEESSRGRQLGKGMIKAALKVNAKNKNNKIQVYVPMVSTLEHWAKAKEICKESKQEVAREEGLDEQAFEGFKFGIMYETLQSIINLKLLMADSDFGSIGSSDLVGDLLGHAQGLGRMLDRSETGIETVLMSIELITIFQDLLMGVQDEKLKGRDYGLTLCGVLGAKLPFLLWAAYAKKNELGEIVPSVGIEKVSDVIEDWQHIDTRELDAIFGDPKIMANTQLLRNALEKKEAEIREIIRNEQGEDKFKSKLKTSFVDDVTPAARHFEESI